MKHKHVTTCEHEIKVCDCCDSAYCTKCDKEWPSTRTDYVPTYIPYYPLPVYPHLPYPWATPNPIPYGTFTVGTNTWDSRQIGTNLMMQSSSPQAY